MEGITAQQARDLLNENDNDLLIIEAIIHKLEAQIAAAARAGSTFYTIGKFDPEIKEGHYQAVGDDLIHRGFTVEQDLNWFSVYWQR